MSSTTPSYLSPSLSRTSAELQGGLVGGVLQALTGHPFDLVKVRLQTQALNGTNFRGPLDCASSTLKHEGVLAFYKGVSVPIVSCGILSAALYAVNGASKRLVRSMVGKTDDETLNTVEMVASALITSPAYCAFVAPVDLVKNRLQVQSSKVDKVYSGPIDVVVKTVKKDGAKAMFDGYTATVIQRMVGLPFLFVFYDLTKQAARRNNVPESAGTLTAGFMAGVGFWGVSFPMDLIKTQMQNSGAIATTVKGTGGEGSVLAVATRIYKNGGIGGFYRGYLPCVARAGPANAVVFLAVEMALEESGCSSF